MRGPSAEVLTAFGLAVDEPALLLTGGMGRTWAVGDAVLKPVDDAAERAWVSEVHEGWPRYSGVCGCRSRCAHPAVT